MKNAKIQTTAALATVSGPAPAPTTAGQSARRPAQPVSAARQPVEGSRGRPEAPRPGGPPSGGYMMGSGIGGEFMLGSGN
jgi:hypothetical protein